MAAADQDSLSNAWQDSHSDQERARGSIFASTVIESLTSINGVAMQPEDPNESQVATFNAYTRSIIDICRSDVTRFWDQQNFTFSAQDDNWEGAWDGGTGIPSDISSDHLKDRWNQLVDVPHAGGVSTKMYLDPRPSNTSETVTAQLGRTGGLPDLPYLRGDPIPGTAQPGPADLRKEMTTAMIIGDVRKMAGLFRQTCPGDWSRGWGVGLSTMLTDAVRYGIEPDNRRVRRHTDIAEFIRYRWELAEMADSFVQEHKLRKPSNDICLLWNDLEWSASARQRIPGYQDRWRQAFDYLLSKQFNPKPMRSQGPPFERFDRYMAAAIALTDLPREENERVLQNLVCHMERYKEFYKKVCVEDKGVLQKGREWQEAIG